MISSHYSSIAPTSSNHPPRQLLRSKILLKKNQPGKMRIKQIIEFELRGPGLPGCSLHVLLKLVIFITKY